MARNVEIKARIASIGALLPKVVAIADQGPTEIIQDDTFFGASWKAEAATFSKEDGELIFYAGQSTRPKNLLRSLTHRQTGLAA